MRFLATREPFGRPSLDPFPSFALRVKSVNIFLWSIWPNDANIPTGIRLQLKRGHFRGFCIVFHAINMAWGDDRFQAGHVCHNQTDPLTGASQLEPLAEAGDGVPAH